MAARLMTGPRIPKDVLEGNGNGDESAVVHSPKGGARGKATSVEIKPIQTAVIELELIGTAPLVVNQFPEKARREMRDKHLKKAKLGREVRKPFEEFVGSLHIINHSRVPKKKLDIGGSWPYKPDTFGVPAAAFKSAAVSACSFLQGTTKTLIKGAMHVVGELVPLKYVKVTMREDIVRVGPWGNRQPDLRYRGEFSEWSARVQVRYNKTLLTVEQIANLFEHAGFHVGVGEGRPEKEPGAATWGTFAVRRA